VQTRLKSHYQHLGQRSYGKVPEQVDEAKPAPSRPGQRRQRRQPHHEQEFNQNPIRVDELPLRQKHPLAAPLARPGPQPVQFEWKNQRFDAD